MYQMPISFEEVQKKALALRQKYAEKTKGQPRNFLIYGHEGTGKTRILTTVPKPVLVANFDPGGPTTRDLLPFITAGDVIIEDYSGDSRKSALQFRAWEKSFQEHIRDGMFQHIGTYVIDSLTRWSDAMMNEIVRKGGFKNDGIPQQRDYLVQQITAVDYIGMLCEQPCHTICTGHIALVKDDVEGRMHTGLLLAGKMSDKVPLCFDEKYITRTRTTSKGIEFNLQTRNDGQYRAETRMGGSLFEPFEEPDIKALMEKAGIDNSDKPSLF
jgi:hypothetical protein